MKQRLAQIKSRQSTDVLRTPSARRTRRSLRSGYAFAHQVSFFFVFYCSLKDLLLLENFIFSRRDSVDSSHLVKSCENCHKILHFLSGWAVKGIISPIIPAIVIRVITVHQRCRLVVRMMVIVVRERHARIWIR